MNNNQVSSDNGFLHPSYFILVIGLACGAITYFVFAGKPLMQSLAVVATGIFYILWGIIDHARENDLHLKVVLEYILISSLAMVLLLTLIFRS